MNGRVVPFLFLLAVLLVGCGLAPGDVTDLPAREPVVRVPPLRNSLVLYKDGKPLLVPLHLRETNIGELMDRLFTERRPGYETAMAKLTYEWSTMPSRNSHRDLDSRQPTLQVHVSAASEITEKALLQITCTAIRNWDNLLHVKIYREDADGAGSEYGPFRCRGDLALVRE